MSNISQITSIRTNINSFGGEVVSLPHSNARIRNKVSSTNLGGFGDDSIDHFYKDLSELNTYKSAKICITAPGIIEEYINKFRSNADDIVTIAFEGDEIEESKSINNLFRSINFDKVFFGDKLHEYIYFGSELFLIRLPKSGDISEAKIDNLRYPFSSIVHKTKSGSDLYVNGERLETKGDEYFYVPLRIGKLDLELEDGKSVNFNGTSDLLRDESWLASKPLFHGLVTELKLFILKDILTALIQIQDIISPNLLLANVDKNTSEEKATELATNIEQLINQYGDLTQLIASTADVTTLSQFILNNVRVYPDLLNILNGVNKLDFTRLTGKNQEIRNELDNTETQLINAVGLPIDLYRGNATNKYDALKQSDRLLAKVTSEMNTIDSSIEDFCIDYLKGIGKYKNGIKVKVNLFDYSFIEGINSSYKYDTSTQYIRNIANLARDIKETLESTKDIFDTQKFYRYLTDNAELVYPGFKELMRTDFIDNLSKESNEQDQTLGIDRGSL